MMKEQKMVSDTRGAMRYLFIFLAIQFTFLAGTGVLFFIFAAIAIGFDLFSLTHLLLLYTVLEAVSIWFAAKYASRNFLNSYKVQDMKSMRFQAFIGFILASAIVAILGAFKGILHDPSQAMFMLGGLVLGICLFSFFSQKYLIQGIPSVT